MSWIHKRTRSEPTKQSFQSCDSPENISESAVKNSKEKNESKGNRERSGSFHESPFRRLSKSFRGPKLKRELSSNSDLRICRSDAMREPLRFKNSSEVTEYTQHCKTKNTTTIVAQKTSKLRHIGAVSPSIDPGPSIESLANASMVNSSKVIGSPLITTKSSKGNTSPHVFNQNNNATWNICPSVRSDRNERDSGFLSGSDSFEKPLNILGVTSDTDKISGTAVHDNDKKSEISKSKDKKRSSSDSRPGLERKMSEESKLSEAVIYENIEWDKDETNLQESPKESYFERVGSFRKSYPLRIGSSFSLPRKYGSTLSSLLAESPPKKNIGETAKTFDSETCLSPFTADDIVESENQIIKNDDKGHDVTYITTQRKQSVKPGKVIYSTYTPGKKSPNKNVNKLVVKAESETKKSRVELVTCVSHVTKEIIKCDTVDDIKKQLPEFDAKVESYVTRHVLQLNTDQTNKDNNIVSETSGTDKDDPTKELGALTRDIHGKTDSNKKDRDRDSGFWSTREKESEKHESKSDQSDSAGDSIPQRKVVVHRDAKGYGLTVSGESPVFVQSVKENGAAEKAGVRQGDRIIKVNGTLVANSNHVEVVKLIRTSHYVQLTLQAKPEPQNPVSPDRISGPHAVDKRKEKEFQTGKIATIRTYYDQVSEECGKLRLELQKNPNSAEIKSKLDESSKMQKTLEQQLFNLTGIPTESMYTTTVHQPGLPPPGGTSPGKGDMLQHIQEEILTGLPPYPPSSSPSAPKHRKTESVPDGSVFRLNSDADELQVIPRSLSESRKKSGDMTPVKEGFSDDDIRTASLPASMQGPFDEHSPARSPAMSPREAREAWTMENVEEMTTVYGSPDTSGDAFLNMQSPTSSFMHNAPVTQHCQQAQVISMEDEEFSTDDEHLEDHGPFSDLNNLKHRPGHLAVFLYYLLSNSDPSPLLFYLITETYTLGAHKDLKKWAYEIYSTFLHEKAPLKVNVSEEVLCQIESTLTHKHDKEDSLKNIFQLARHMAQNDISEQLQDFRNKRALGLANLFGAQDLNDEVIDKQAELKTVEKILWPEFEKLSMDSQDQSEKNQAIAMGLSTFFRIVGLNQTKTSVAVERVSSFMLKEKKVFRVSRNKKGFSHKGHTFMLHQYIISTFCGHCQGLLWGAGGQGWQCQNCEFNAHKICLEKIKDDCAKRKKDKDSNRRSVFEKFPGMGRRPTNTNPAAIKEAQRIHDESVPLAPFNIRPAARDEEEDDLVDAALKGDNLLRMSSRTISLPSITHAGKRSSVYVSNDTPPSTPIGKSMPKDHEQITGSENVRNNAGHVQGIIQQFSDLNKSDGSPSPHGKSPEPFEEDTKKKGIINIGRSESLNKKGEKRKSVRRTRSDVQVDEQTLKALEPSNSSSTSSLSNRSTESPSNSNDGINDMPTSPYALPPKLAQYHDDSDFEVEVDLPSLDKVIPRDMMKKLKPKDKKRQDVLNELLYTERNHCRGLKVMHRYFYVPMSSETWISRELVKNLFQNLEELITVHGELNSAFKKLRAESPVIGNVAQILLDRFKGEPGDKFKTTCATFCQKQSQALDQLRYRMRKDQKFALFLQEASNHPDCRRLALKDYIPTAMQRLTKYPLLIDNLLKYTSSSTEEYSLLEEAHKCAKSVLAFVNQAVKECENLHTLEELQKKMDKKQIENSTNPVVKEYKNLQLSQHKLMYDGPLTWRINKQKQVDLHVVLLEDIVVLLQKQDDKLVLRCQNTMLVSGRDDTKFTHSPIITVKNLMVKQVATDKKGIFLVSPPQIYELVANTTEEKKKWFKHFTDVAKLYEGSQGPKPVRRNAETVSTTPSSSTPVGVPTSESADHVNTLLQQENSGKPTKSKSAGDIGQIEQVAVMEETELIQPEEVTVSTDIVVQETPDNLYDKLQQQDEIIQKAMAEKLRLMAGVANVPQEDFYHVAELASEDNAKNEPSQFVLATIHQSKRLTSLVNDNLNNTTIPSLNTQDSNQNIQQSPSPIPHGEQNGTKHTPSSSSDINISLPGKDILSITNRISDHLSQLMIVVQKREAERVLMEQKLNNLQDQVNLYRTQLSTSDLTPATTPTHTHTELHISEHDVSMQSTSPSGSVSNSRPVSFISVNSETSDSAEQGNGEEESGSLGDNGEDELALTLTPLSQQDNNLAPSGETSHSSSSTSSTNSISTQEVKVQMSEVVVEKLQVLESENKFDKADKVGLLYEEADKNDESSSSDNEKLEIVEDDKTVKTENNVTEIKEAFAKVNIADTSNLENVSSDSGDIVKDSIDAVIETQVEPEMAENVGASSKEALVVCTDTLVRNIDTTQLVTSETQTYETVAQVTEFTENIVAETVLDDENANIEYTPDIVPECIQNNQPTSAADTTTTENSSDNNTEEETQEKTCQEHQPQENSTSTSMEMDCQTTEMDAELLALIEAAERIEQQQEYDCEGDGFEDAHSQGDEDDREGQSSSGSEGSSGEEETGEGGDKGQGQQDQQQPEKLCNIDEETTSVEL